MIMSCLEHCNPEMALFLLTGPGANANYGHLPDPMAVVMLPLLLKLPEDAEIFQNNNSLKSMCEHLVEYFKTLPNRPKQLLISNLISYGPWESLERVQKDSDIDRVPINLRDVFHGSIQVSDLDQVARFESEFSRFSRVLELVESNPKYYGRFLGVLSSAKEDFRQDLLFTPLDNFFSNFDFLLLFLENADEKLVYHYLATRSTFYSDNGMRAATRSLPVSFSRYKKEIIVNSFDNLLNNCSLETGKIIITARFLEIKEGASKYSPRIVELAVKILVENELEDRFLKEDESEKSISYEGEDLFK